MCEGKVFLVWVVEEINPLYPKSKRCVSKHDSSTTSNSEDYVSNEDLEEGEILVSVNNGIRTGDVSGVDHRQMEVDHDQEGERVLETPNNGFSAIKSPSRRRRRRSYIGKGFCMGKWCA